MVRATVLDEGDPTEIADGGAPDVLVVGRLGVDLYPTRQGVGLEDADTFEKSLGGSAANVAVAVARFERSAALVSRVGDDPFGRYLRRELGRYRVDARHVAIDPVLKTPITFCELFPPDDFPLYFYREPSAPDLHIEADEAVLDAARAARILWATGTGLSREPSRAAHHAILAARARVGPTVLDLDYRATFWERREEASAQLEHALGWATIAIGNREECAVAVGETDPSRALEALLDRGVELAIVKCGPDGVLAGTRDQRVQVDAHRIDVVNGLGAGDAFGGAVCHGLLAGWDLERTVRFANAAGAIVAERLACSSAMPASAEVDFLLAREGAL